MALPFEVLYKDAGRNKNLNALLSSSESAKTYFMALPDYVQGMIQQRTCDVHSMDELRRYAETRREQF